jgi:hypothetical protein
MGTYVNARIYEIIEKVKRARRLRVRPARHPLRTAFALPVDHDNTEETA